MHRFPKLVLYSVALICLLMNSRDLLAQDSGGASKLSPPDLDATSADAGPLKGSMGIPIELVASESSGTREAEVDLGVLITGSEKRFRFDLTGGLFDPSLAYELKPDCGCADAKILAVTPKSIEMSLSLRTGTQEQDEVVRLISVRQGSEVVARLKLMFRQVHGISIIPNEIRLVEGTATVVIAVVSYLKDETIDTKDVTFEGSWILGTEILGDGRYSISFETPSSKFPLVCRCHCRCVAKTRDGEKRQVFSEFFVHRPSMFRCLNKQLVFTETEGKWMSRAWLSGLGDGNEFSDRPVVIHVSSKSDPDKLELPIEVSRAIKGNGAISIQLPSVLAREDSGTLVLRLDDKSIDVPFSREIQVRK